jgi:hypothetical protein|eukprot:SAG25_NODE_382_length_8794_cov_3.620012_14_plen_88_part_00
MSGKSRNRNDDIVCRQFATPYNDGVDLSGVSIFRSKLEAAGRMEVENKLSKATGELTQLQAKHDAAVHQLGALTTRYVFPCFVLCIL